MKWPFLLVAALLVSDARSELELEDALRESRATEESSRPPLPAYVFQSLKDQPAEKISAFFKGMLADDRFLPKNAVDNSMPPDFWRMASREAALALARTNQTAERAKQAALELDDSESLSPPASGWIVYERSSSGCYSSQSMSLAIRFGDDDCLAVIKETQSNGAVGSNIFADQRGHSIRTVPLRKEDARLIADTIFWLKHLRTPGIPEGGAIQRYWSSADGFGKISLWTDDLSASALASGSVWAGVPISTQFSGSYSEQVMVNLIYLLLEVGLKERVGQNWNDSTAFADRNLSSPVEERLQPRQDAAGRLKLEENIRSLLAFHQRHPVPPPLIEAAVTCVGQEAMASLLPQLVNLSQSLAPTDPRESEYIRLQKTALNPDDGDDPAALEARSRYFQLSADLYLSSRASLRAALATTLEQLRIASDPDALKEAADDGDLLALRQLRLRYPALWIGEMTRRFASARVTEKESIFETLAAVDSEAAKRLIQLLSPQDLAKMQSTVVKFELKNDPAAAAARVPTMLATVRTREADLSERIEVITLLPELPLDAAQKTELTALLRAERTEPQRLETSSYDSLAATIKALSSLLSPEEFGKMLNEKPLGDFRSFEAPLQGIAELFPNASLERSKLVHDLVILRLKESQGMMNDVFLAALTFDVRDLAPDITSFATADPGGADGNGANSWGGTFKNPVGQHYHVAREISAIWSEKYPTTLGRMWLGMALNRSYPFSTQDPVARELRDLAGSAISAIPPEQRKGEIASFIALAPEADPEVIEWLQGLSHTR